VAGESALLLNANARLPPGRRDLAQRRRRIMLESPMTFGSRWTPASASLQARTGRASVVIKPVAAIHRIPSSQEDAPFSSPREPIKD
jgi:hypothetical protein